MCSEEGVDGVEHVVEVGVLVDGAVVHDEFVVGLDAEADVEGTDAGVELGGEDGGGGAEVLWGSDCVSVSISVKKGEGRETHPGTR